MTRCLDQHAGRQKEMIYSKATCSSGAWLSLENQTLAWTTQANQKKRGIQQNVQGVEEFPSWKPAKEVLLPLPPVTAFL